MAVALIAEGEPAVELWPTGRRSPGFSVLQAANLMALAVCKPQGLTANSLCIASD